MMIKVHLLQDCLRELAEAGQNKDHPFRFFTLATSDGIMPDARMVVLRAFDSQAMSLSIFTDARSRKIRHLEDNPNAVALFWHPRKRWQIKIGFKAMILSGSSAAAEFEKLPEQSKTSYNSLCAPGKMVDTHSESIKLKETLTPDYFTEIKGQIYELEVLRLKKDGHIRAFFQFTEGKLRRSDWLVP